VVNRDSRSSNLLSSELDSALVSFPILQLRFLFDIVAVCGFVHGMMKKLSTVKMGGEVGLRLFLSLDYRIQVANQSLCKV